jgi:hypothetical protein
MSPGRGRTPVGAILAAAVELTDTHFARWLAQPAPSEFAAHAVEHDIQDGPRER